MSSHKTRIAARFDAAAARYDDASPLQREAAQRLAQRVLALPGIAPRRVLEIGCGTGHLTRALCGDVGGKRGNRGGSVDASGAAASNANCAPGIGGEWTLSDIAPAMLRHAQTLPGPRHHVVMDAERPAFAPGSFDLIVSSLTAQWFADLPATLGALCALLAPGGHLALATLAAGTFQEWQDAHTAAGVRAATHAYPDAAGLARAFPSGMLTDITTEDLRVPFAAPLDFVRGLRAIGADTPPAGVAPLSAGQLRRVLRQLGTAAPVGITYRLLYAIAQRPD